VVNRQIKHAKKVKNHERITTAIVRFRNQQAYAEFAQKLARPSAARCPPNFWRFQAVPLVHRNKCFESQSDWVKFCAFARTVSARRLFEPCYGADCA
jgi:hypothetical protein